MILNTNDAVSESKIPINRDGYCAGLPQGGIGHIDSDQFWAKGPSGKFDQIELTVFSNYSEPVYVQMFKEDGFFHHIILSGIGSNHTFIANEANEPVYLKCRIANSDDARSVSRQQEQKNARCARIAQLTEKDIVSKEVLENRDLLRIQIAQDMLRYKEFKDECADVAGIFRRRATKLKEVLRDFTRDSAENAAQIGELNDAVLGVTAAVLPALGAAKGTLEQRASSRANSANPPQTVYPSDGQAKSIRQRKTRSRGPCTRRCPDGRINEGWLSGGQCRWETTCP